MEKDKSIIWVRSDSTEKARGLPMATTSPVDFFMSDVSKERFDLLLERADPEESLE